MEIFIEKQLVSVGYSLILGLIFGAAYDIIRMIHILCGTMSYSDGKAHMRPGGLAFGLFLLTDLLYVTAVSAVFSVFVYWTNYGDFRGYLLFAAVIGFLLYSLTLGRVVMYFSDKAVRLLRLVLRYTVALPLMYAYRILRWVCLAIYRHTLGVIVKIIKNAYLLRRNKRFLRQFERDITFNIKQ